MPLEDEFGDIVKKARTGQGLSAGDLAQATGLGAGDLTVLERCGRKPTATEVRTIATALKLRAMPLEQIALEGWAPVQIPDGLPSVETIHGSVNGYAVKGYILFDGGEALFVDTAYHADAMLAALDRRGLALKGVCLTHGHADHADGLDVILQHHHVPVYLGREDENLLSWQPPKSLMAGVTEGRVIQVGTLTVECLKTPGHTPGGTCYRVNGSASPLCFVGDTLFAGSIGRANPAWLYPVHLESVRRRLLTLPPDTILLPGHGPATTVAEEVSHNPFAMP